MQHLGMHKRLNLFQNIWINQPKGNLLSFQSEESSTLNTGFIYIECLISFPCTYIELSEAVKVYFLCLEIAVLNSQIFMFLNDRFQWVYTDLSIEYLFSVCYHNCELQQQKMLLGKFIINFINMNGAFKSWARYAYVKYFLFCQ